MASQSGFQTFSLNCNSRNFQNVPLIPDDLLNMICTGNVSNIKSSHTSDRPEHAEHVQGMEVCAMTVHSVQQLLCSTHITHKLSQVSGNTLTESKCSIELKPQHYTFQ